MPLPSARLIDYQRLVAPRDHLGVLCEPEAARLDRTFAAAKADPVDVQLLDTTTRALRDELLAELGFSKPLIVVGHQPEFLHAGVFAKNLAAAALARRLGATPVYLVADTDVPKTRHIPVPQRAAGGLRRVAVEIPGVEPAMVFADQPEQPREKWASFFGQVGALHPSLEGSALGTFARAFVETPGAAIDYVDAQESGRRAIEAALDLQSLVGLRMSAVARRGAFRAFVAEIALRAEAFAMAHNAAQHAYRLRHKVRHPGRPVPPLILDGPRIELPFWIAAPGGARRRLFVERRGDVLAWLADRDEVFTTPDASLRRHADLPDWPRGVRIWPRALALSLFVRLMLGDLFIHGIGGAKYDEMTEEFCAAFFGRPPAPMCCVTATLHLPLDGPAVSEVDVRTARLEARDLRYNPQRRLPAPPADLVEERASLVRRSDALRAERPEDHLQRREVFLAIRAVSARLLESDPWRLSRADQRVEDLARDLAIARVARDREYFVGLQPLDALRALRDRVAQATTPS